MRLKSFAAALIGIGLLAENTTAAADWRNPAEWLNRKPAATKAAGEPAGAAQEPSAPVKPEPLPNYRAIMERFGPAVVGVITEGIAPAARNLQEDLENDPFFRFFRGISGIQERIPGPNVPRRGQSSGFLITDDGLILTNAHVVRDARTVTVKLHDRREYKAKVLGSDPTTDVAVLKINAANLPLVHIGDPSRLEVGTMCWR